MADPLSIATWRNLFVRFGKHVGWLLAFVIGVPLVVGFGLNQFGGAGQQRNETQNVVVAKVNGDAITAGQFATAFAEQGRGAQPGEMTAQAQGMILEQLIRSRALIQEAKRRGLSASAADIDKVIEQGKASLGQNITDAQWEAHLIGARGMDSDQFRDYVAEQLLIPTLEQDIASKINVTEEEARKQHAEVKFAIVTIPAQGAQTMPNPQGPKPLPDAEAKQKAEDLLAKVKAGADIAAIARANSGDMSAKSGGVVDWRREYQEMSMAPATWGSLFYGKEFDEAIRKAQKGELTDVVKLSGIANGYGFAKVLDRRTNLPKEFDVKKEVESLKAQKARAELLKLSEDLNKKAKVEISDPDKKAFYEYMQLQLMQQRQLSGMMGQGDGSEAPKPEEIAKQKETVEKAFEEMLKRNPDDATAATLVANSLKAKLSTAPKEQQADIRKRLIGLYETVLKTTENRPLRFELAQLYRDNKQEDLALRQYDTITKLLDDAPPYDLASMQEEQSVRQQLATAYKGVSKPDKSAEQDAKAKALIPKIKVEQAKAAAAQKEAASTNLTLPAGQSGTVEKNLTLPGDAPAGEGGNGAAEGGGAKPEAGKPVAPGANRPGL